MAPELITRPNFTEIHTRIANNPDFFPFFKDYVGAMDGTLVPAWVPRADQNRYRSRKSGLVQNVLAICDFDMNFTYVYTGWEGSAADALVLDHAVSHDPTFPFPPIAKYYLVDAGFKNYQCFLAPYRGTSITYLSGEDKVVDMEPHRTCSTMHIQDMAYCKYLESVGYPQDLYWTLNVEQQFMWMIVDDNTRAPMRDDTLAEA
ncbi:UNVERIFIED_CONTAM: hypothetical protein Sradi_7279100 [Sesamum radiatum]|uniref:DDE Tnp4 domain-containing protein n=1 Tax=Sesamum radiatum TaxID=300843 RepID=A0AAW2IHY5_SESRA